MIAIDTETHPIPTITWKDNKGEEKRVNTGLTPKVVCLSEWGKACDALHTGGQIFLEAEDILRGKEQIAGANIAFDFGVLIAAYPDLEPLVFRAYEEGRVFDVLIAESLDAIYHGTLGLHYKNRKPDTRYSLAYVTEKYLGIDVSALKQGTDVWRLRYAELDGVPVSDWPDEAISYAMGDAEHTYKVAEAQMKVCKNLEAMPEQSRAAWALHLTSARGMQADPNAVAILDQEWNSAHQQAVERFSRNGWLRPNGSKDTKLIKAAISAAYQGKPPTTETGRISLAHETLLESENEELVAFAGIAGTEKLRTTYLPVLKAAAQNKVCARYDVLKETGRTSCQNPNFQNLPRKGLVRECFVPRDGYVFAFADYAMLELCTLSEVCMQYVGYSKMGEAINADRDVHVDFAADLLQMPYADLLARYVEGDQQAKDMRQLAKAFNFGLPGGLGPVRFIKFAKASYGVSICEVMGVEHPCGTVTAYDERTGTMVCTECHAHTEELRGHWFSKWPEVAEYHQIIAKLARQKARIKVPGLVGGIERGGCGFCDGANTGFQGLAARGAKAALYHVVRECHDPKSALYGSHPCIFIHDEIGMESPETHAPDAAERLAEAMAEAMQPYTPHIRSHAEPVLMRRWYKGAKTKRDAAGRLVLWEPTRTA